jgi:hypothetical protein
MRAIKKPASSNEPDRPNVDKFTVSILVTIPHSRRPMVFREIEL